MKCISIVITACFTLCLSINTSALTAKEFNGICEANTVECHDIPAVQAYIGGALDLLATLDEQTEHLDKIYCKDTKELFQIPEIVKYMNTHAEAYASRNAMILLVKYVKEKGAC